MKNQKKKKRRQRRRNIAFEELFEPSLKRKIKNFLESDKPIARLTNALLLTAALGGVLAIGVMAPNLFKAFGMLQKDSERSKKLNKNGFIRVRRACYQLKKRGLIEEITNKNREKLWRITEQGEQLLVQWTIRGEKRTIAQPTHWDGKWRIIIFDIPTTRNSGRDALRYGLRLLGCYQLQRSVWIHPFPCVKEIFDIAFRIELQNYVRIYTIEDFSDTTAKLHFKDLLRDVL